MSKETAAKIHEKAQPFIKWLKEAEEESESEDDDIEVDFDTRAHVSRYFITLTFSTLNCRNNYRHSIVEEYLLENF